MAKEKNRSFCEGGAPYTKTGSYIFIINNLYWVYPPIAKTFEKNAWGYFTNPLFAHLKLFQRDTKIAPRMFSSSTKANHIPISPKPNTIPKR